MELVQTFCTIEFAVAENPQNHLQNQKYHSQKKLGLPEFKLSISHKNIVLVVAGSNREPAVPFMVPCEIQNHIPTLLMQYDC